MYWTREEGAFALEIPDFRGRTSSRRVLSEAGKGPLDTHASLVVALAGVAGSRERTFWLMYLVDDALKQEWLVGVRLA
ncbi:hypothetical protein [Sorangium sp. So ce362]|uniref:hypothetical protein n=1 Tax=Sorangium sp. So ce362 TaxID=3133303 RepID=UPI003F5E3038